MKDTFALVPLNKDLATSLAKHGDRLLTLPQMAEMVHKKERTIQRWMRRGRLPHFKIGPVVLFPHNEVMDHLRAKFGRNLAKA